MICPDNLKVGDLCCDTLTLQSLNKKTGDMVFSEALTNGRLIDHDDGLHLTVPGDTVPRYSHWIYIGCLWVLSFFLALHFFTHDSMWKNQSTLFSDVLKGPVSALKEKVLELDFSYQKLNHSFSKFAGTPDNRYNSRLMGIERAVEQRVRKMSLIEHRIQILESMAHKPASKQ